LKILEAGRTNDRSSWPAGARTQTSIATAQIRSEIVTGTLRPLEKLRVQFLAKRYGLAASAIREALSRLVTDGLVDVEDQRGFRVGAVSRDDLEDLTETRVGIESLALTRAIEFGDVAWESDVLGAYHRLSRCARPEGPNTPEMHHWAECHRDFHRSLIAACRSEWLLYFCGMLYERSDRYRMLTVFTDQAYPRNADREHEELMTAVISRDASAACSMIRAHFWETTRLILGIDEMAGGLGRKSPKTA
jgi:DNA-binding GntR family transcriptional regulator